MSFLKKIWTDRVSAHPNRRILTNEDTTTNVVTVARYEGIVSQQGDAFSATNMNDLEDRIEAGFNAINPQADSGYVIIGNTLIQWGQTLYNVRPNNSAIYTKVTLPIPFANSDYFVSLTPLYSADYSAYYDAISTYSLLKQDSFRAEARSKSDGFTTDNFPAKPISVAWIAIGKYTA